MNTQQKTLHNASITRITKQIKPDITAIFENVSGDRPYLNKDLRQTIIAKWHVKYPAIKIATWRVYLTRLEQKFFEEQPAWSQRGLINKMTIEAEDLKDKILTESHQDITKQAKAITDVNTLTARIHRLTDAPPAVSIMFNTNVNEDELTQTINTGFFGAKKDPEPDPEQIINVEDMPDEDYDDVEIEEDSPYITKQWNNVNKIND